MPRESDAIRSIERMKQVFGDQSHMICMVTIEGDVRTADTFRRLLELEDRIASVKGVRRVRGPIPKKVLLDGRMVSIQRLTEEELPKLFDRINELAAFGGILEKSKHAVFQLLLEEASIDRALLRELRHILENANWEYVFSGEPFLEASVFDYVLRILFTFPPIALVLVLLVFRWRIGSIKATGLAVFPAVVAALLTLGGIGWILGRISLITAVVPLFVIVLGSADGLHFTTHVLDELDRGSSRRAAVRVTLEAVGIPMVLTTITTAAGFLSMLFIRSDAIRTMGLCASAGIVAAGCVTWFLLPVLLIHVPNLARRKPRIKDRVFDVVEKLRGRPAIILSISIAAISVPGILLLRADFNMLSLYKPRTEVRKNIETVNEILGGAIPVSLLYHSDDDLFAPPIVSSILSVQEELRRRGVAPRTYSIYDAITGVQAAMRSGQSSSQLRDDQPSYPEDAKTARLLAAMIDRMQPGFIRTFVHTDEGVGRIVVMLNDLDDETLETLLEIAAGHSDRIELTAVGIPFVLKEMNDQIIPQQLVSLLFACVLVLMMVSGAHKSIRVGGAAILPIVITLIALFGVMGYAGIHLSIITGIMSGLTIGVGIDYGIHYAALFRYFRRRRVDCPEYEALRYVSAPVLANAMGLAIGFSAMLLSPLRIHTYVAILMWVTMLCSGVLSLTLLPTVLANKS